MQLPAFDACQVYKAELDGVSEVALKLLKPETVASDSSSRKFLAEIDVLRACRDQHIVAFLGAWAHKASNSLHERPQWARGICLEILLAIIMQQQQGLLQVLRACGTMNISTAGSGSIKF